MEQTRSTLLPNIINYLKKYSRIDQHCSSQMILRVYRNNPLFLTDGFFSVQAEGVNKIQQNAFLRIKSWKINVSVDDLALVILDSEILGIETMSDYQLKLIKNELQVRALMIPAFRYQLQRMIVETPINEIMEMAKLVQEYE